MILVVKIIIQKEFDHYLFVPTSKKRCFKHALKNNESVGLSLILCSLELSGSSKCCFFQCLAKLGWHKLTALSSGSSFLTGSHCFDLAIFWSTFPGMPHLDNTARPQTSSWCFRDASIISNRTARWSTGGRHRISANPYQASRREPQTRLACHPAFA